MYFRLDNIEYSPHQDFGGASLYTIRSPINYNIYNMNYISIMSPIAIAYIDFEFVTEVRNPNVEIAKQL